MTYIPMELVRQKLGGRSRSSIYRDVATGRLPVPLKIGRNNYWVEAEVDQAIMKLRSDLYTSGSSQ